MAADLIDDGLSRSSRGNHAEALGYFERAARENPADAEASFFAGMALNRLGRFKEAYEYLNLSNALLYDNRDLPFELGWSALQLGRFHEALDNLNEHEESGAGTGQTIEFMGRALLGLKRTTEARRAFRIAQQRDSSLQPTIQLSLAYLDQASGNVEQAMSRLQQIPAHQSGAPLAQLLQQSRSVAPVQQDPQRAWGLEVSMGIGYNTNVLATPDNFILPGNITRQSSVALHTTASASYRLYADQLQQLSLGYYLHSDVYEGPASSATLLLNYLYLDYSRRVSERLSARVRTFFDHIYLGGHHFRNGGGLSPSLYWKMTDSLAFSFGYDIALQDYASAANAFVDRDGAQHTLSFQLQQKLGSKGALLDLGWNWRVANAEGTDFDGDANTLFAQVTVPLPWQTEFLARYSYTSDVYDNPTSFSPPTGFVFARRDELHSISLSMTKKINPRLSVFARYAYVENASNLGLFEYNQHVMSTGVTFRF